MRAYFEVLKRELMNRLLLVCRSCGARTYRDEHCRPSCPDRSSCCEECAR